MRVIGQSYAPNNDPMPSVGQIINMCFCFTLVGRLRDICLHFAFVRNYLMLLIGEIVDIGMFLSRYPHIPMSLYPHMIPIYPYPHMPIYRCSDIPTSPHPYPHIPMLLALDMLPRVSKRAFLRYNGPKINQIACAFHARFMRGGWQPSRAMRPRERASREYV